MADISKPPVLKHFVRSTIELGEPMDVGQTPDGFRRIVPILGGSFSGPDISGTILPFGGDFQTIKPGGQIDLDARYLLKTDEGELIYVSNIGNRYVGPEAVEALIARQPVDMSLARSTGAARLETGAERLQWINQTRFFPRGQRGPQGLLLDLHYFQH
jgi:hypothetical protein